QKITTIFHDTQKGYRFISYQLRRHYQLSPNPKTVLRYMHILGHQSPIRKKRYHSCTQREINEKARHVHYNVLARNFKAERPLQKLTTDVSYVYHKQGRMFLSVIKDCYDNSILAYTLSDFNDNKLVFDNIDLVFHDSWDSTKVCVLHSDQGFQYTNQQYLRKLDQYGVTISHSGKGNCYDNAVCENFFSHLKSESLRLFPPENKETLVHQIREYIDW
ncbi:IS3 family transposase, partial [Streptococcus ruminantium]